MPSIVEAIKDFGARLRVVGLLPTVLAVSLVAFLVAADAPAQALNWSVIGSSANEIKLSGLAVITAVSIAIAVSLHPLQFRLVQLLEGYWPAWTPSTLARLGIWSETLRRTRIARRIAVDAEPKTESARIVAAERSQVAEIQVRERFPEPHRILPTALGNALRASEDRVGQRYGLEGVVIWPRLYRLLPKDLQASLDDEVDQLDLSARLTVTWSMAAVVGTVILVRDLHQLLEHPSWALVVGGVWLLARLSYSSAVESAVAHGLDVEVAIDLHRGRVVEAMRLVQPTRMSQERRVFRRLSRLFQTYGPSTQDFVFSVKQEPQPRPTE